MSRALVLASGSQARGALLQGAGLSFTQIVSDVDEAPLKEKALEKGLDAAEVALALARAKAGSVSLANPAALVIGADQILVCGGRLFDKPRDLAEARENLGFLSGKAHRLETAVCVFKGGEEVWHHVEAPELEMRPLTGPEIDRYLALAGDLVLTGVGCYQLEGPGIRLFERISGDYFSILGLTLIPLLAFLRSLGVTEF